MSLEKILEFLNSEGSLECFKLGSKDSLILGFLTLKVGLTQKHVEKVLENFENIEAGLKHNFQGIFKKDLECDCDDFKKFLSSLAEENIKVICTLDENYPKSLLNLYDPPPVLFYQGDLSLIQNDITFNTRQNTPLLSVVGARNIVPYGVRKFVKKSLNQL